jgi:two-component system NtrC family response regulator
MKTENTILIVDDEAPQRLILSGYLKQKKYKILEASSPEEAKKVASSNIVDLILSDLKMPGGSGIDLLKEIKKMNPEIQLVIITAHGTIENAVEAMKEGAFDYLLKPVNLDELDFLIKKIFERKNLISENKYLKEQLSEKYGFKGLIAYSKAMDDVLNLAARVAESKATVLIRGESGTGKEILAKAIHYASPRADNPFVAVNCAALNENLLESEMFGHEKGSFTGADKQKRGRFELADTGTLFLDEVGDLPPSTQIKLLRVLQEGQFERVGGTSTLYTDVRIISATNRNIEQLISENKFREDLYYRLNVVTINIPPLRERREDLIHLIEHFLKKYITDTRKEKAEFSKEALDILMKYDYPGNVRELENIVHHSVVLAREEIITTDDLPGNLRIQKNDLKNIESFPDNEGLSFTEQVENLEKKLIFRALDKSGGNQTKAAKMLGISERNLRYRLNKWGIKK